ncbi:hypothetical protein GVX82_00700 [Patescibacteria group bacterium]|jgi:4-amino-4-deoxy-L-arabinose transferase-like glycosyltransferase|nr:hypothetical protein [Patescibacteria group bacterium]
MDHDHTALYTPLREPIDKLLFVITCLIGGLFAAYAIRLGVHLAMVDQFSHLAIARQITDSMTPGLSQLGFWPPLVHILMAPFAAIGPLFTSGIAAPLALVPILALSAVYLFRLLLLLGVHRPIAMAAVAAYVLNPYVLYYAVTPMSDTLFMALLIIATYYLARWWLTDELFALMWMGAAGALASLARFEGFFLIAFAGLSVLLRLFLKRAPLVKMEAAAHLYGLVAGLGVVFILAYGITFAGDPLEFMNNEWGAYAQQRSQILYAEHDLPAALTYLLSASEVMVGGALVVVGTVAAIAVLLCARRARALIASVVLLLLSPFIFDLFALFQGSAVIYLPELPPFNGAYFNERYGLYWLVFLITMPALAATMLYRRVRSAGWYLQPVALFAAGVVACLPVAASHQLFTTVACAGCFEPIRNSLQSSPGDQRVIAQTLNQQYDGGRILMTRALHNEVAVGAGVPLSRYILEANEHYFDQALKYPWLFADWVVMHNARGDQNEWARQNERVALLWTDNEQFDSFYTEVYVGDRSVLYRLDHAAVRDYAARHELPRSLVPTLGPNNRPWDVEETFAQLDARLTGARPPGEALSRAPVEEFEN